MKHISLSPLRRRAVGIVLMSICSVLAIGAGSAHAAAVTFPQDTTLTLSGIPLNFIIKADSSVDSITANASSFTFTISPGQRLLIRSNDNKLFDNTANLNTVCAGNASFFDTSNMTISSQMSITVTPSGNLCTTNIEGGSSSSSGGGGGGGGGGWYPIYTPTPTPSVASSGTSTTSSGSAYWVAPAVATPANSITFNHDTISVVAGKTATFNYSFANKTGVKQSLKLTRDFMYLNSKTITTTRGVKTLNAGASFTMPVSQSLTTKAAPGMYQEKVSIYDAKSGKLLGQNSAWLNVQPIPKPQPKAKKK